MVDIIRRNWPLAKFISVTRSEPVLICILKHLTKDQTRFLTEIVLNVLLSNIIISRYYRQKLKRDRKILHKLVSKETSYVERKKIMSNHYSLIRSVVLASLDVIVEASV